MKAQELGTTKELDVVADETSGRMWMVDTQEGVTVAHRDDALNVPV